MTAKTGFKISRQAVSRRAAPGEALPEHGDAERLRHMTNTLRELGDQRAAYAAEIGKLWRDASEKFLAIGRYLRRAKERLPHGQYEAMIAADLPFGRHVALQLKSVAEAVDAGRVLEDELPPSYTTAYKLIELKPDAFAEARRANLVRPDVTRREILVFRRRLVEREQAGRSQSEALDEERTTLKHRLIELAEQQKSIRRRLAEIEAQLDNVDRNAVI